MKKRLIVIIMLLFVSLVGCKKKDETTILTPDGIPSIALGGLMNDWDIKIVSGVDLIVSELLKAEYDIIVAPITAAAKIYLLGNTNYQCRAIITTGNTYLAKIKDGSNEFDLTGKKLAAYGENNVPNLILDMVLEKKAMQPIIQFEASVNDVVSNQVLSNEPSDFFMLAEPFLSMLEIKQKKELTILDLQNELDFVSFIPQAGVFVKKGVEDQVFISDLEANILFLNAQPEEYASQLLLLPSTMVPSFHYLGKEVISQSIPRCNIVYYSSIDYQQEIETFFQTVNEFNENIIGGIPDEAFYGS